MTLRYPHRQVNEHDESDEVNFSCCPIGAVIYHCLTVFLESSNEVEHCQIGVTPLVQTQIYRGPVGYEEA